MFSSSQAHEQWNISFIIWIHLKYVLWPAYLTMFLWGPTHPNFLNHSSSITLNTMFIPYGGVDAWCLHQVLLLGTLRILSHSWHNICIQLFGMTQCYILFMILYLVEMAQQWPVDSSYLILYLSSILYINTYQSTKSHLLHITMNSIYQWWSIYICFRASLVFDLNYFYILPKPFMLIHFIHFSYFSVCRSNTYMPNQLWHVTLNNISSITTYYMMSTGRNCYF